MSVSVYVVLSLLLWLRRLAHLDLLYARVPLVHLLHSEKQNVVELIDPSFQDRLQPEHSPSPRHDFAIDDIAVALTTAEDVEKLFQQSTVARDSFILLRINQPNTGISYKSNLPQWSLPSSLPCSPVLWWLFSELLGLFSHRKDDLSFDLQLQAQALQKILLSDASSMQRTKLIMFFLTVVSEFCRRSGGMRDPSPPLQVRDLLAYHCNGCTLKSCVVKTGKHSSNAYGTQGVVRKALVSIAHLPCCGDADKRCRSRALRQRAAYCPSSAVTAESWRGFSFLSGLWRTLLWDKQGSCR